MYIIIWLVGIFLFYPRDFFGGWEGHVWKGMVRIMEGLLLKGLCDINQTIHAIAENPLHFCSCFKKYLNQVKIPKSAQTFNKGPKWMSFCSPEDVSKLVPQCFF